MSSAPSQQVYRPTLGRGHWPGNRGQRGKGAFSDALKHIADTAARL